MWVSARSTRVRISACSSSCARSVWARTSIATSVATWSLRERAVWSLAPESPTSSVSRRSMAMCTSSSPGWITNVSPSTSARTWPRPRSIAARSSSSMMPEWRSIRAWASDWSMS